MAALLQKGLRCEACRKASGSPNISERNQAEKATQLQIQTFLTEKGKTSKRLGPGAVGTVNWEPFQEEEPASNQDVSDPAARVKQEPSGIAAAVMWLRFSFIPFEVEGSPTASSLYPKVGMGETSLSVCKSLGMTLMIKSLTQKSLIYNEMSLLEIGVRPFHHMLLLSVRNAPDSSLLLLGVRSCSQGLPALLLVSFTLKASRDIAGEKSSSWDLLS